MILHCIIATSTYFTLFENMTYAMKYKTGNDSSLSLFKYLFNTCPLKKQVKRTGGYHLVELALQNSLQCLQLSNTMLLKDYEASLLGARCCSVTISDFR